MFNKKISTLIGTVIILAVAVVAFAVILILEKTQIPVVVEIKNTISQDTETAGWKTYVNNDLGFQFSYPKSWYIVEPNGNTNANPLAWFKMGVYTGCAGDGPCGNFNINVTDVSALEAQKFPIVSLISDGQKNFVVEDMPVTLQSIIQKKTKVNVFGKNDGYETIVTFCYGESCGAKIGPISIVDILVFGKIYHIEYAEGIKNNTDDWAYYEQFKQILSTFKFIDKIKNGTGN